MSFERRVAIVAGDIAPYVTDAKDPADAALRSAQVCRDEMATLAAYSARWRELEAEAEAWESRAEKLEEPL
jgi:hypothetical protein